MFWNHIQSSSRGQFCCHHHTSAALFANVPCFTKSLDNSAAVAHKTSGVNAAYSLVTQEANVQLKTTKPIFPLLSLSNFLPIKITSAVSRAVKIKMRRAGIVRSGHLGSGWETAHNTKCEVHATSRGLLSSPALQAWVKT